MMLFNVSHSTGPGLRKWATGRKVFLNKQENVVRDLAIGPGGSYRLQNSVVLHLDEYNQV